MKAPDAGTLHRAPRTGRRGDTETFQAEWATVIFAETRTSTCKVKNHLFDHSAIFGFSSTDADRLVAPGRIIFSSRVTHPQRCPSPAYAGRASTHRSSNPPTGGDRIRTATRIEFFGRPTPVIVRSRNDRDGAREQQHCSLSARLLVQTERQWWATETARRSFQRSTTPRTSARAASASARVRHFAIKSGRRVRFPIWPS